jgi:hypothetical protein
MDALAKALPLSIALSIMGCSVDRTGGERGTPQGSSGATGAGGTGASGGNAGSATGGAPGTGGSAGTLGAGGNGGSGGATNAGGTAGGTGSGGLAGSGGAGGSAGTGVTCDLPASFAWTTGSPVITPQSDASHDLVAVKDPTIVRFNDLWHVYASMVTSTGVYGMVYTSFADFSQAPTAPLYYMDATPGFDTYVAAPQLFYFAPQNKWYLVFQSGPPMYSTNDDPGDPTQWTVPKPFYASEPPIITQNDGWLDFWVICDDTSCHLFFSDDHGRWYKAKTSIENFPNGFDQPIVVMEDPEAGRLFEACNVYKVAGSNKYLALIEAFDSTSNWRRYFRSWTSESLEGPWVPLQDSGSAPFAGASNVTFAGGTAWSNDISHGEAIRAGYDQTLELDACNLQFIFQGYDPSADGSEYNKIPWKLGLLQAP